MTAKRFTLTNPKNAFQEMKCGIDDRGNTLTFNEVVDLLNEQYETIQRLKQNINELLSVDVEKELLEENEQLKTIIQQLRTDNTKQKKLLNTTMKENEQLKIALKDKENLISICEKKFKELGYLITCDDDGYVIE